MVVVFDSSKFRTRYPELSTLQDGYLQECFAESGLYLSNKPGSIVSDVPTREVLLYMLTAHIATLKGATTGGGVRPVGAVTSATEGSVSVSFDATNIPGSAAWYAQTQYGLSFWQATSSLRGFRWTL